MAGLLCCVATAAGDLKILTNHLGYEPAGPKHAVIQGSPEDTVSACSLMNADGKEALRITPVATGPVNKWKDWVFWTLDFDAAAREGKYSIQCETNRGAIRSYPFAIQARLLDRNTLSDVIYYFKEERSSGQLDKADRHLPYFDNSGFIDAHGGWFDATGDYSKNLSHLSFATYFNSQQLAGVDYALFESYRELHATNDPMLREYGRRLLDEAMFGADYLVRIKDPAGSFFRSVTAPGPEKSPADRRIGGEVQKYEILQSKEDRRMASFLKTGQNPKGDESGYRAGAGVAIAALAMASTYPVSGDFKSTDYLKAAEDAFDYLAGHNLALTNDGKENIIDDYCALAAATELFRATHQERYKNAADRRAKSLTARLVKFGGAQDPALAGLYYWRADDGTRPFFHPVDAGFPVVSLLYYADIAGPNERKAALDAVRRSLEFELAVTGEVANPFGYSRQFVQNKSGARYTSFFFPHETEASPWWQGENARLASLSAAARMAMTYFKDDAAFTKRLDTFATAQLDWILGMNPFDSSMLNGVGHNNPAYMFFDSWAYTNAPGGISNGITSGWSDENDIDFRVPYTVTGTDSDWRWSEQWLPHDWWYLLAVSQRVAR